MAYSNILFPFLGGLGLFLFSIKYMGEGLRLSAGDKLRNLLDKYTTNPFLGVLSGILVTALIQSSSGTTVITIGLVTAGFLNLRQAIGIIMGANVGTTVTSFIIGFNLSAYSLPIIFVGAILLFFVKQEKLNNLGSILFGLGGIFYALKLMSGSFIPLRNSQYFMDLIVSLSHNSVLGVIIGTILTVIIQSSSATIGILQGLYQEGLIPLSASLPVLFGDNIGTTITAILACITASNIAKRVALSHVLFNLIGTILFIIFLGPFTKIILYAKDILNLSPKLTIAFAHGTFNVLNVILQFPFIGFLAFIVTKLIPEKEDEKIYKAEHLNRSILESEPVLALSHAKKEVLVMFEKTVQNLGRACEYFTTRNVKLAEKVQIREDEIDKLDHDIAMYLTDLFKQSMPIKYGKQISALLDSTRDIERIGDHAMGLVNDVQYQLKKKLDFSDIAKEEVNILHNITNEMLQKTMIALEKKEKNSAIDALDIYNRAYAYEKKIRKKHIQRMNEGTCELKAGLYYVDIVNHFTRICDHARNINEKILNNQIN